MTIEKRVKNLETQVKELQDAFFTSQRNLVPTTAKVDSTANKVDSMTPYTASKTAYIGDTEITFMDVPEGNMTVYLNKPYTVDRDGSIVTIYFEALEEVTDITISIIGG